MFFNNNYIDEICFDGSISNFANGSNNNNFDNNHYQIVSPTLLLQNNCCAATTSDYDLIDFSDDNDNYENNFQQNNQTNDYICRSIIKNIEAILNDEEESVIKNNISSYNDNKKETYDPVIKRPKSLNKNYTKEENKENYQSPPAPVEVMKTPMFKQSSMRAEFFKNKQNSKQKTKKVPDHCVFCLNNGQPNYVYETHKIRDIEGRVICPKLRDYKCPICGLSGDKAHTIKYCPEKPTYTMEDAKYMNEKRNVLRDRCLNKTLNRNN